MDKLDAQILAQFRTRLIQLREYQPILVAKVNASELGIQLIGCNSTIAELAAILEPPKPSEPPKE